MTGCQRRPKQEKEIKIMNKPNINKRSLVIMLCVVAFFTMGSVPSASATTPTPVTITAVYDFSTFPDVTGTFTTSGALTISGLLQFTSAFLIMVRPLSQLIALLR